MPRFLAAGTTLEMVSTPEYEQAHEHRESGLERTVLIACTERMTRLAPNK